MDSECAGTATSFIQGKNKDNSISDWELLQNKFIKEKNSCFAEVSIYISGTEPHSYIYDLTHNKEIAGFPINVSKYAEVKSEIFGSEK